MIIKWSKGMCIGIKEIDEQHEKLVSIINEFSESLKIDDQLNSNKIFNRLMLLLMDHFDYEQKLLEDNNYPQLTEHIEEHCQLLEKGLKYKGELVQTIDHRSLLVFATQSFLFELIKEHILGSDRKYVKYIKVDQISST